MAVVSITNSHQNQKTIQGSADNHSNAHSNSRGVNVKGSSSRSSENYDDDLDNHDYSRIVIIIINAINMAAVSIMRHNDHPNVNEFTEDRNGHQ